jgi:hypothetical protein
MAYYSFFPFFSTFLSLYIRSRRLDTRASLGRRRKISNVGFKGFAKPKILDRETVRDLRDNVGSNLYVFYTGGNYGRRKASGRSKALATVTEKGKPVSLRTYIERAAKAVDPETGKGFGTDISVGGLSLHQGAKPAVYLYLEKDDAGNYRAVKDIPTPDTAVFEAAYKRGGFKAGEIVLPAPKPKPSTPIAKK